MGCFNVCWMSETFSTRVSQKDLHWRKKIHKIRPLNFAVAVSHNTLIQSFHSLTLEAKLKQQLLDNIGTCLHLQDYMKLSQCTCRLVWSLSTFSGQLLHQKHEQGADLRFTAVQKSLVSYLSFVSNVLKNKNLLWDNRKLSNRSFCTFLIIRNFALISSVNIICFITHWISQLSLTI